MASKKTIVLGASPNPERASYQAVQLLNSKHHEVIALGIKAGTIDGIDIQTDKPTITNIDTISLYVGPDKQSEWYPYLLSIHPRRIIFNPGTENPELLQLAQAHGIQTETSCTLVLLSTGQY